MRYDPRAMDQAAQLASEGSPLLVAAIGRLVGLSGPERTDLSQGRVPSWVWVVAGASAGVLAGVQLQKRWPRHMRVIGGG